MSRFVAGVISLRYPITFDAAESVVVGSDGALIVTPTSGVVLTAAPVAFVVVGTDVVVATVVTTAVGITAVADPDVTVVATGLEPLTDEVAVDR